MKRRKHLVYIIFLTFSLSVCLTGWQFLWTSRDNLEKSRKSMVPQIDIISVLERQGFVADQADKGTNNLQHYGYNVQKSLSVGHSRILPDTRSPRCLQSVVNELPSTSVVIVYQEVDRSALLRNIASILSRSHPAAIKELIIVDDGSSDDETSEICSTLKGVRVIKNETPKGRGNARMQGAEVATGEVIVFIDCLMEMNVDWLSPLLQRIMESPKSLVVPTVEAIDHQTLEYKPSSHMSRGGIDWSLQFQWVELPAKNHFDSQLDSYFRTPIQSGAMFAVRRNFFMSIGQYEGSIGATGVEDIELSLRVWMCGGQIEILPCSRAGLIQLWGGKLAVQRVPFNTNLRGSKRVSEMWLDEYRRFFYAVRPSARMQPLADLSAFRKMKERLKCQNFKWFLSNVYPQLLPLVSDEIAYGFIKQQDGCLDLDVGQLPLIVKLRLCRERKDSQEWSWRKGGMIVSNGMCLTSDLQTMKGFVMMQFCKALPSQVWVRQLDRIIHQESGLCLDGAQGDLGLKVTECRADRWTQEWQVSSEVQIQSVGEPDFSFSEDNR